MSTPDQTDDEFGFTSLRATAKDRIRDIKPSGPAGTPTDMTRVDAVADAAGFTSREAPLSQEDFTPVRGRRVEPRTALNMRVPARLGVAFQRFCDDNRYSYPEGLEEIMRRAGLPLK